MTFENFKELYRQSTENRVNKSDTLFHGTYAACLQSILENGLLPDSTEFWKAMPNPDEDYKLYFTFDKGDAIEWAELGKAEQEEWLIDMEYDVDTPRIADSPIIVLAVKTADMNKNSIGMDDILCEDMYDEGDDEATVTSCTYTDVVSPDKIYVCELNKDGTIAKLVKLTDIEDLDSWVKDNGIVD